jgi:hypothetical protein
MDGFQTFVIVEGLSTRADKSIKIVLSTQELKDDAAPSLFALRGRECYCAFFPYEVKLSDIQLPKEEPEFKGHKTPSERLRNVLFRVWQHRNIGGSFDLWRASEMERLIDSYKSELPNAG